MRVEEQGAALDAGARLDRSGMSSRNGQRRAPEPELRCSRRRALGLSSMVCHHKYFVTSRAFALSQWRNDGLSFSESYVGTVPAEYHQQVKSPLDATRLEEFSGIVRIGRPRTWRGEVEP